jgi:hypothetical protein
MRGVRRAKGAAAEGGGGGGIEEAVVGLRRRRGAASPCLRPRLLCYTRCGYPRFAGCSSIRPRFRPLIGEGKRMRVEGASERPNAGVQKEGGTPGASQVYRTGLSGVWLAVGGDDLGLIVRGLLASR